MRISDWSSDVCSSDLDLESVRQSADAKIRTERGQPMVFAQETASGEDFADYINWREKHPSDDVMTQLLHAEFKDETGTMRKLTRGELLAMINMQIGRAHVRTPVTNAHLVCRLPL